VIKVDLDVPAPNDWRSDSARNNASGRSGLGPMAYVRELAVAPMGASIFVVECAGKSLSSCANTLGGTGWMSLRKERLGYRIWKIAEPQLRSKE